MWNFLGSSPAIEVRMRNTLLGETYPRNGGVMAVLDTGYSGFLLLPTKIFRALRLDELMSRKSVAWLADGMKIEMKGAVGSIEIPGLGRTLDGMVQTLEGASEILIGMDGIRGLFVQLDCCNRKLYAESCEPSSSEQEGD